MAKIRIEYKVPDIGYCDRTCANEHIMSPCDWLVPDGTCAIFGRRPAMELKGLTRSLIKLDVCRAHEVKS